MDILTTLKRAVKNYPDSPAIVDGDVRMNWQQYGERNRRLSAGLRQLGLQKGDRVAVLMLNSFRYFELYYALPVIGGIIVPLNSRYAVPEIVYVLEDSETKALVVDDTFAPLIEKINAGLTRPIKMIFAGRGATPPGMIAYESLLETGGETFEDFQPEDDDIVGFFYTGGTTGKSKGVMLTHKNLASNALHVAVHLKYQPHHNYLHVGPMFHLADGASTYAVTMMGGCHTFLPAFDPVKTFQIIQSERVTHCLLVPTMINALIQTPNIKDYDLSSWQGVLYGASPIPTEVLRKALSLLPCKFNQGYGMTEAAPLLSILSPEAHEAGVKAEAGTPEARRLMSCGQPCVGMEIRIVNDRNEEVDPGEIGEIIARGPNIMKGYWNLPDETAFALRDGWYHSGDLAFRDDHNYYFIVDRKKDMIISGGENIYSVEVENAVYSHPAVLEAAVIGLPDDTWGERVHAVVVLRPGMAASEEEIIARCRELIGGFKVPRSVEFMEALPKSGAGKILKRDLRDKYWQDQTRQVH